MRIRTLIVCAALSLLTALTAHAQNIETNQQTSAPADSRYEIIQSSMAAKWTFRLDKVTGLVYQLVTKKNGDLTWDLMTREPNAANTTVIPGKVNYQIFTSGIAAKFTFLMNVNSGATWQLTEDTDTKESFWAARN